MTMLLIMVWNYPNIGKLIINSILSELPGSFDQVFQSKCVREKGASNLPLFHHCTCWFRVKPPSIFQNVFRYIAYEYIQYIETHAQVRHPWILHWWTHALQPQYNTILNSEFYWRFSFENGFKNIIEYWPVVSHLMASGWLQGSESDKVVDGR